MISIWISSDEVVSCLALSATSAHPNPYRGEVTNKTSVVVDCLTWRALTRGSLGLRKAVDGDDWFRFGSLVTVPPLA